MSHKSAHRPSGPRCSSAPAWETVYVNGEPTEVLTLGNGTPIVFLHGWGLSPRSYLGALRRLARRGYRVIAPSLPGFGNTPPLVLGKQNVGGVANHVAQVLDALGIDEPVHVLGHSFGGGVALRLGSRRPDLVKGLVLVCPVGGAGSGAVPLLRMVGGVISDTCHRWTGRALRDFTTALTHHPTALVATALAAWQSDQIEDLQTVDQHGIATRVLFGDRDEVVTPGEYSTCGLDSVTCQTVKGKHGWLLTDPNMFLDHVIPHLNANVAEVA